MIAGDPALARALDGERARQEAFIELIASENYVSERVLAAQGSVLTNKYADGYPGRRVYSGCEWVDVAESLAIERAARLFGAGYVNVQPYSGSTANVAVFHALMTPGDTLLGMQAGHGGHITHGDARNLSGTLYKVLQYGVTADDGLIDYDAVASLALRHRPRVIVAGFSAYPRRIDWAAFRAAADRVGAYFVADIAHVAGPIAAGLYPSPVGLADVVTTTTHKTLRGPRGGMILARTGEALGAALDAAVWPGLQGGPLMHVIAAKAAAFGEALEPGFVDYQRRVLANAASLAARLAARGLTIVTGGTDNHMLLVDMSGAALPARDAAARLEAAHIATNAIRLPRPGADAPNGLRLGTAAVTSRGFGDDEIAAVAGWVADLLERPDDAAVAARVRAEAGELCRAFPVYADPMYADPMYADVEERA